MLPTFNNEALENQLSKLGNKQQLAFGAVCCERLLPNYLAFQKDTGWGDIQPIQNALNLVWAVLIDQKINSKDIKQLITSCEETIPDSEDFESLYVASAQDACFAVCSLLDYLLNGDVGKIVEAATYATDSVDLYVQETEGMIPNDPGLEQKILTHDLMQRELYKQKADLKLIKETIELTETFLNELKYSWSSDGKSNLDIL